VEQLRASFPEEKFLLCPKGDKTYMVLEQSATGEDALRGWLVAGFASEMERSGAGSHDAVMDDGYHKMESVFPMFDDELWPLPVGHPCWAPRDGRSGVARQTRAMDVGPQPICMTYHGRFRI
jgi:hypothetical protein